MKTLLKYLGLAALASATAVACTVNDPLVEEPVVEEPAAKACSVKVTVGAGIADGAQTKSTVVNEDGVRVLKFTEGDKLYVYATVDDNIIMAGKLDIVPTSIADGTSASFTGNLALYEWDNGQVKYVPTTHEFTHDDPLADCTDAQAQLIHAGSEECFMVNEDPLKQNKFCLDFWYEYTSLPSDAEAFMTSYLDITASDYDATNHRFVLERPVGGSIFSCTVSGLTANATYSVSFPSSDHYEREQGTTQADADGVARFAFDWIESSPGEKKAYSIILSNNEETHDIPLGERILEEKIYNVTRRLVTLTPETGAITLNNNDILTGTGGAETNVTIADGATVTLKDVTINSIPNDNAHQWAGITCAGDAHIIIAGTNTVKGGRSICAGIYVPDDKDNPGNNKTLIIDGTGTLNASSYHGAGIGGGHYFNQIGGNIVINGGTINASSETGACIGAGRDGICGSITINGGTVTAQNTVGTEGGAGIGTGESHSSLSSCGDISITGGTVVATTVSGGAAIGTGRATNKANTCGDISITGGTVVAMAFNFEASAIGTGEIGEGTQTCGTITIGSDITSVIAVTNYTPVGPSDGSTCGTVTIDGHVMTSAELTTPTNANLTNLLWAYSTVKDPDDDQDVPKWTLTRIQP